MRLKKRYKGVVVPLVTPLTAAHRLDGEAVEKILDSFRKHQTMPFILGTTGEASSLPLSLRKEYIRLVGSNKQPGDVLYAGISSNCLAESVELAHACFDAGFDVVAAHLPSYYPLSESQIQAYFEQLAEQVPGPLVIYNIPATTRMSIPLRLIDQLSHHEKIVGTKDSERSEDRLQESLALWAGREDFSHFLGWAAKSGEALLAGSDGLIPSTGNFAPALYQEIYQAALNGDREHTLRLQRHSDLLGDLYQGGRLLGESLAALKILMQEAGLLQPHMMPPLQRLSGEEETALRNSFYDLIKKENITFSTPLSHV
jgi:dihydrodipicolinate synthase/N-acetylneuraminate lyase